MKASTMVSNRDVSIDVMRGIRYSINVSWTLSAGAGGYRRV